MLEEANARLKKGKITEEQLWGLNSLYILLDLHKDDFCKIVDAVGLEQCCQLRPIKGHAYVWNEIFYELL